MSPMTPPGLRAQAPSVAGVQGAARPARTGSGDDFARALRQETHDRVAPRPHDVARPERAADRSVSRPVTGTVDRRDRPGADGSVRTDRVDRADRAGGPDRADAAQQAEPSAEIVAETTEGPVTPALDPALEAVPLVVSGLVASGSSSAELLVRGAVVVPAPAPAGAGGDVAGSVGAASAVTALPSTPVFAAALPGGLVAGAVPGVGSGAVPGVGPGAAGAPVAAGLPDAAPSGTHLPPVAASSATANATANAASIAASSAGDAGTGAAQAGLPAAAGPIVPVVVSPAPTAPAELSVLAPGLAGTGAAPGGQAGGPGTGSGAPGTEGMTPVAAPTSGVAPASAFAQALAGVGAVDRVVAPTTTGPASQVSFAEQVRGPVLALRTAAPGEHLLTLKVTPDNLGPVQVRAHIGAEGIRIELVGATDAAREGLRNLLTDLRRDLAGTGMNASLSLGSDSGPGARTGQGAPGDLGAGSSQGRPGHPGGGAIPDLPVPAPAPVPTSSGAHGVDVLT